MRRADLSGADKAVSEVLDEINARMHGLFSSGSYHEEFQRWLAERGYQVARVSNTGIPRADYSDWESDVLYDDTEENP